MEQNMANGHRSGADQGTISPGGMSKVERYKWKSGTQPGVMMWIDKHSIRLAGEHAQRSQEQQEDKIRGIAAEFEWPWFGVLTVVEVPGESVYWVIDGGGRHAATLRRADITKVPCIVFKMDSLEEQAKAFLGINEKRKPVTAVAKFYPRLVAKVPEAVLMNELCEQAGRRVAIHSGPNTVSCVTSLMKIARSDAVRLKRLWPLICDICRGGIMHERVVESLVYIDRHMNGPELLTDKRWSARLKGIGADGILQAANKAAAYYAKGGAKVWAQGVVDVINKGLREENRLTLQTGSTIA